MSSLTRRNLLRLGGTSLGLGIAGCLSSGSGSESPEPSRLVTLGVSNYEPEPCTVYVLLLEDDEPVYWNTMAADAFERDENRTGGGTFDGYPTEPGSYVLYAWRDDQSRADWQRFDFREYDTECLGIYVKVGFAAAGQSEDVSFWWTSDCQGNEPETG